ncbi:hypothetical protein ACFPA1_08860 [Neobacillus sp. GCM10023253]|uniref:hypothetical protein n=1 Tax=Neobacillus sp. GCM10023253 TaxID=3252644 RepID=UPI00360ECAE2
MNETWMNISFILVYLSFKLDAICYGYVWIITRENRNIKRIDTNCRFEIAPYTSKGENGVLQVVREIAEDLTALLLLKQNGLQELE